MLPAVLRRGEASRKTTQGYRLTPAGVEAIQVGMKAKKQLACLQYLPGESNLVAKKKLQDDGFSSLILKSLEDK